MKIIIDKIENISFKDIINISYKIPNSISGINTIKEKMESKLFKIYNDEIIYSYIKKENKIISFGKIINKDKIYEKILHKIGVKEKDYLIGTDLFTIKKERGKGYAQILKQEQIKYIQENYPKIKKLAGATTSKGLLELYQLYGTKYIGKYHIFNKNIYFYYYNI